jgi:glycerol-3-phosphate acyltransferase PlsY
LLDIVKGFIAVVLLGTFTAQKSGWANTEAVYIILGVICICGHNWTVFLNFKGGKGIATTLGVLLGLAVKIGGLNKVILLLILTWFIIFIISRIVSLSSIITAVSFPAYMVLFNQPRLLIFLSLVLSLIVIMRHKPNLARLFKGEEPRLSFKKAK